jgi:hypothetical protein
MCASICLFPRCYEDDPSRKPVLWNSYVRVTRRELVHKLRGFNLGIYGGLGHHRYPTCGSGDTYEVCVVCGHIEHDDLNTCVFDNNPLWCVLP